MLTHHSPLATQHSTRVRWLIRRDLAQVVEIEQLCFPSPWSEKEFLEYLRNRSCIGYVVTPAGNDRQVLGFAIKQFAVDRAEITNLAVHPSCWRRGHGRRLVAHLQAEVERRELLLVCVRETNVTAQVFFRACGFRLTHVERDFYADIDEERYCFEWRKGGAS